MVLQWVVKRIKTVLTDPTLKNDCLKKCVLLVSFINHWHVNIQTKHQVERLPCCPNEYRYQQSTIKRNKFVWHSLEFGCVVICQFFVIIWSGRNSKLWTQWSVVNVIYQNQRIYFLKYNNRIAVETTTLEVAAT